MEENQEKSIFENLLILNEEVKKIPIVESERRRLISWSIKVARELNKLLGKDSIHHKNYRITFEELKPSNKLNTQSIEEKINNLNILVETLVKFNSSKALVETSSVSKIPSTKNIFIIHGHDELNTHRLHNIIQNDFHLNPIAIFLKPGQSKSIIDKFEDNAQTCSFAFALFTKDDEIKKNNEIYFQARPNVIFESGWFTGRLGKNRLVLILQNDVKMYSDFEGISRIQFDSNVEEKYKEIRNELVVAKLI